MENEFENFIPGAQIGKIKTFEWFGDMMILLLKSYPSKTEYQGIIEYFEREHKVKLFKTMHDDGLIDITSKEPLRYRLSKKGVEFAVSMIQLDYAEKMDFFTKIVIITGIGTLIFTFLTLLTALL